MPPPWVRCPGVRRDPGLPFPAESFDVVVSVAALHHMDAARGLARMAGLLRPGGRLALVGLARASRPSDLPWELGGAVAHRILRRQHTYWEPPSPIVWPPPVAYSQLRRIAATVLPGSTFRRRLLWRYSLMWTKPRD